MSINRKACKKHCEIAEVVDTQKEHFEHYVEFFGDKRLMTRLNKGRRVKPCGRECWEYGKLIAESLNHGSFANFNKLMDDEEFLLTIARITPNPTMVDNYFYLYINPYLKKKSDFKLKLLKEIYMNENILSIEDINIIVDFCGFQEENEILLNDIDFKNQFMKRFEIQEEVESVNPYTGVQPKKKLKIKNVSKENKEELTQIVDSFKCKEEDESLDDLRALIKTEFFV